MTVTVYTPLSVAGVAGVAAAAGARPAGHGPRVGISDALMGWSWAAFLATCKNISEFIYKYITKNT